MAAEFTTGAIGTWLTFELRRFRVLTSKLVATGVTGFLASAALVALLVGTTYAISRYAGTVGALPPTGCAPWAPDAASHGSCHLAGLVGQPWGADPAYRRCYRRSPGYAVAIEGFLSAREARAGPSSSTRTSTRGSGAVHLLGAAVFHQRRGLLFLHICRAHPPQQADGARFWRDCRRSAHPRRAVGLPAPRRHLSLGRRRPGQQVIGPTRRGSLTATATPKDDGSCVSRPATQTPIERKKSAWIRTTAHLGPQYAELH